VFLVGKINRKSSSSNFLAGRADFTVIIVSQNFIISSLETVSACKTGKTSIQKPPKIPMQDK